LKSLLTTRSAKLAMSLVTGSVRVKILRPEKSIVIYDKVSANEIRALFQEKKFVVFDPRFESVVFLRPLIHGLLNWLRSSLSISFTHHYFVCFLHWLKPSLVITAADNNRNFFSARKYFQTAESRFVVFQQGFRWVSELPESGSLKAKDIVFCATYAYAIQWAAVCQMASIIPSGTLGSKQYLNERVDSLASAKAGFVSSWSGDSGRSEWWTNSLGSRIPHSEVHGPEIHQLKKLMETLRGQKLTLEIIGTSQFHANSEYSFYEGILGGTGWAFSPRSSDISSYQKIKDYAVLFSTDSTLGYEALSSLARVMFLDTSSGAPHRLPFGYPNSSFLEASSLHLRANAMETWDAQIRSVRDMSLDSFRVLASEVLGEECISIELSEVIDIVCADARE